MATFRGVNNKKAYETQPSELIKKNEQTGEVQFAMDKIIFGEGGSNPDAALDNGDLVLLSKLPAHSKVLRVKAFVSGAAIAAADINVGHSGSDALDDKDDTVSAVTNAFIDAFDPDAADSADMTVSDAGFLAEFEKDVFVMAEIVAAPTAQDTDQEITVIVEYVSK